jgi:hypothetical protein
MIRIPERVMFYFRERERVYFRERERERDLGMIN